MNGIRLTPFLLFVILLVVLIFAMLFGSSSKAVIQEGMDSEAGTFWSNASSANYNSMNGLSTVYINNDGNNNTEQIKIYFNPLSGSVIIPTSQTNYTLLTRKGSGTPVSSDTGQAVDGNTIEGTDAPWSYSPADKNYSIIYCPYDMYTLIIVINTSTNTIPQVFRNYQAELNGSPVSQVGVPSPNNAGIDTVAENNGGSQAGESEIDIDGTGMVSVNKIANEVYYSDKYGITVGQPGSFESSKHYKTRITKLNNGSGGVSSSKLIIGTMIETRQLLIAVIKKSDDGNYMVLSNNHIETAEEADQNDSLSIGLEVDSGEGSGSLDALTGGNNGSGSGSGNGSNGSNVNNNPQSCNSQYQATSTYTCPNGTDVANNPDYIKKTEVVPPVCPGCPPCPVVNPDNCSLSINSKGEIVDCTGKKYEPDQLIQGSSPGSWSGSLGEAVGDTAQAVGDVAEKGIDTVGDVADKTLDTASGALDTTVGAAGDALNTTVDAAGNIVGKTIDGAGNIVGEVGDTIGDLAGGLGQGVAGVGKGLGEAAAGLGTGASNLVTGVTGDVAGLGNNLINSTTGLVGGAGEGISNLAVNEQLLRQQQQLMQGQQGYGYQQQQGMGYAPQYGYGYPMQPGYGQPMQGALNQSMQPGYGYSYPQSCPRSSSNFMPVTNDFSQFT